MSHNRTNLLGLALDDLSPVAAVATLLARPPDAAFAYVVTPNADHFARLRRQPTLRPLYEQALLCLLDSRLIAAVARRLGLRAPAVVTGVALTAGLLGRLDRPHRRHHRHDGCRIRCVAGRIPRRCLSSPRRADGPAA